MSLVFLAIGIILVVVGCILAKNNKSYYYDDVALWIVAGGILIIVVSFLLGLTCLGFVINGRTLDDKIAMYESENAAIEEEINTLVENYMKYESDTYESLKGEDGITLISLYPELKADTLVNQQCELYISNKKQIAYLKEEKISVSNHKFWLYFGK